MPKDYSYDLLDYRHCRRTRRDVRRHRAMKRANRRIARRQPTLW